MQEINLFGEIGWDVTLEDFSEQLQVIRAKYPTETITVKINSGGGDVNQGFGIAHLIQNDGNIDTLNMGFAASISGVIALKGRKRYSAASSMTMLHKAHLFTSGNQDELLKVAVILSEYDKEIINLIAEKTKVTDHAQINQLLAEPGWWMNSASALENGIFDDVLSGVEKSALPKNSIDFVIKNYAAIPFNILNQIITPHKSQCAGDMSMKPEEMIALLVAALTPLIQPITDELKLQTPLLQRLVDIETAEPSETETPDPAVTQNAAAMRIMNEAMGKMADTTASIKELIDTVKKMPVQNNTGVYGVQNGTEGKSKGIL